MSRGWLQAVWTIFGVVAATFGALALVTGGDLAADAGTVSASVDSELRFYAAWYAAAGVLILRTAPRVEAHGTAVRTICAVLFIAACARLLSLIAVGAPHPIFLALMAIEFAYPAVVVPWQAAVARRFKTNEA